MISLRGLPAEAAAGCEGIGQAIYGVVQDGDGVISHADSHSTPVDLAGNQSQHCDHKALLDLSSSSTKSRRTSDDWS